MARKGCTSHKLHAYAKRVIVERTKYKAWKCINCPRYVHSDDAIKGEHVRCANTLCINTFIVEEPHFQRRSVIKCLNRGFQGEKYGGCKGESGPLSMDEILDIVTSESEPEKPQESLQDSLRKIVDEQLNPPPTETEDIIQKMLRELAKDKKES